MSRPGGAGGAPGGPLQEGRGEGGRRSTATQAHHQEEEEEVSNLQVENQEVKQKARDREEGNSCVLAEIQRAKQHDRDHLLSENQRLKEKLQVLKEQVSRLQVENQQVKQKARDQEEENSRVLAEIQRAKQHDRDHLLSENQRLKEQVQVLKEQVSNLQVENQQVKQKARDQEEEISHVLAEMTKAKQHDRDHLLAKNQWLKQKVPVLMELMVHFSAENQQLKHQEVVNSHLPLEFLREELQDHDQNTVPHLLAENQSLKARAHTLMAAVSHQWAENKQLRQQRQDREGPVSCPKREAQKFISSQGASGAKESAKKILSALPSVGISPNKVCRVQVRNAGVMAGTEKSFMRDVSRLLSHLAVILKVEDFRENSQDLLLLFCPMVSHIHHYIGSALEGLSGEQKAVVVVVMHYIPKGTTETSLDTKRVPHPAVVRTVHTCYTLQDGFYLCEMNTSAVADVAAAIKDLPEDH